MQHTATKTENCKDEADGCIDKTKDGGTSRGGDETKELAEESHRLYG